MTSAHPVVGAVIAIGITVPAAVIALVILACVLCCCCLAKKKKTSTTYTPQTVNTGSASKATATMTTMDTTEATTMVYPMQTVAPYPTTNQALSKELADAPPAYPETTDNPNTPGPGAGYPAPTAESSAVYSPAAKQ